MVVGLGGWVHGAVISSRTAPSRRIAQHDKWHSAAATFGRQRSDVARDRVVRRRTRGLRCSKSPLARGRVCLYTSRKS